MIPIDPQILAMALANIVAISAFIGFTLAWMLKSALRATVGYVKRTPLYQIYARRAFERELEFWIKRFEARIAAGKDIDGRLAARLESMRMERQANAASENF